MGASPAKRFRGRRETVSEHELTKAFEKLNQYKGAGLNGELDAAFRRHAISKSSINSWLDNPAKAITASKAPYFVTAMNGLPGLTSIKQHRAYELLLKELGIPAGHATELSTLNNFYQFHHNLNSDEIKTAGTIQIDLKSTPGVAFFQFRYESNSKYRICDGLVVRRGQHIHLIGLSEQNMFFANFRSVRDPSSEIIYGYCSFEEIYAARIAYSRVALHAKDYKPTPKEQAHIRAYLTFPISNNSGPTLNAITVSENASKDDG
jgi:hypothetical protein